jgi:hypothetical protein
VAVAVQTARGCAVQHPLRRLLAVTVVAPPSKRRGHCVHRGESQQGEVAIGTRGRIGDSNMQKSRKITVAEAQMIGLSARAVVDLADEFDVSTTTIYAIQRKAQSAELERLDRVEKGYRGMSEAQRALIAASPLTVQRIAEILSVPRKTVSNVKYNATLIHRRRQDIA